MNPAEILAAAIQAGYVVSHPLITTDSQDGFVLADQFRSICRLLDSLAKLLNPLGLILAGTAIRDGDLHLALAPSQWRSPTATMLDTQDILGHLQKFEASLSKMLLKPPSGNDGAQKDDANVDLPRARKEIHNAAVVLESMRRAGLGCRLPDGSTVTIPDVSHLIYRPPVEINEVLISGIVHAYIAHLHAYVVDSWLVTGYPGCGLTVGEVVEMVIQPSTALTSIRSGTLVSLVRQKQAVLDLELSDSTP